MPTDAEFEAAMAREAARKEAKKEKKKPKPTTLRDKIKRRMERIDEITSNSTTPDHLKPVRRG
jgi:hypothetical protein